MNTPETPEAPKTETDSSSRSRGGDHAEWLGVGAALTMVAVALILFLGRPHGFHGRVFGFYGRGRGGGFALASMIVVFFGVAGVWLVHCLLSSDGPGDQTKSKS